MKQRHKGLEAGEFSEVTLKEQIWGTESQETESAANAA